jgi:hypothetical protein
MTGPISPIFDGAISYQAAENNFTRALNTIKQSLSGKQTTVPDTVADYIRPDRLTRFQFLIRDIRRVFEEADSYRNLGAGGNNQLTQNEITDYLIRTRQLLNNNPKLENDYNILQVIAYYFRDIADVNITTAIGTLRALSAKRLQEIAALDGNPQVLTFEDLGLFLGTPLLTPTPADMTQRLEQSTYVLYSPSPPVTADSSPTATDAADPSPLPGQSLGAAVLAGATPTAGNVNLRPDLSKNERIISMIPGMIPAPVARTMTPPDAAAYHTDDPIRPTLGAGVPRDSTQSSPFGTDRQAMVSLFQHLSFSIREVDALTPAQQDGLTRPRLALIIKLCQDSIAQIETMLADPTPGLPIAQLKQQQVQTRRTQSLAMLLARHFDVIAQMDGDGHSISHNDMTQVAALSGEDDEFDVNDLLQLRQAAQKQPSS